MTLDFDVSTHVQLDEPVESELTREVLVQALLDRSSTGARLRALSFAGPSLAPKVRQAMMLSQPQSKNRAEWDIASPSASFLRADRTCFFDV